MGEPLIIGIDLQEGFLTDELRAGGYIERVEKYLAAQDKRRVMLSRFANEPDGNFVKLLDWPKMQKGDPDTALFGNLEQGGYTVIDKSLYTSWLPEMQQRAKELGATEVIIFGLDTDACVLKTALDIFDEGLQPRVLRDLCGSSGGPERHEIGLELLTAQIGVRQVKDSGDISGLSDNG